MYQKVYLTKSSDGFIHGEMIIDSLHALFLSMLPYFFYSILLQYRYIVDQISCNSGALSALRFCSLALFLGYDSSSNKIVSST